MKSCGNGFGARARRSPLGRTRARRSLLEPAGARAHWTARAHQSPTEPAGLHHEPAGARAQEAAGTHQEKRKC